MAGNAATNKTLYRIADSTSKCNNADIALCEPQPGQNNPVTT